MIVASSNIFFITMKRLRGLTLGIGVGLEAGYSNCKHQLYWQGPPGFPFGRPHWGRPFWGRPGEGGERLPF